MKRNPKIIISCGGTGGHIFPAIEIAKSIKKIDNLTEVLFVGAINKMEMKKVPKAGFPIIGIWIQGFYRHSFIKNILFFLKLFISCISAFFILLINRPIAVIGTGGFVSGPVLFIASILGYNTYIQEQNNLPGITNKILGKWVKKVFVAHRNMDKYFPKNKLYNLGNPVRHNLKSLYMTKKDACSFYGLKEDCVTVLILGGSLGAEPINKSISKIMNELFEFNIQLIWQTGSDHFYKYKKFNSNRCSVHDFIDKMEMAYLASDIVVSRAGAITISEICYLKKACILVPSPHVAENHQTINAKYLSDNNACILVEEDLLGEKLANGIISLNDKNKRNLIAMSANKLFSYNAANDISNMILKDIK